MKFLVISDIHGSVGAVNIIEEAMEKHKCDKIICLGDILYHGPRNDLPNDYNPKKVIEVINKYKYDIIAVRGNCDSEVDQMVLDFPILSTQNILYIENIKIFSTHGHVYSLDNMPCLNENDVFIFGHTHIPLAQTNNGIYILNPGSSSLPKQNHPKTYGILDEFGFEICTFDHKIYKNIKFKKDY